MGADDRTHGGVHWLTGPAEHGDGRALLDLSVNINPYGPCPSVVQACMGARLDVYPDPRARRARLAWAHALDTDPARLAVGHGACDLFWAIVRACAGRGERVVIAEPTFSELRVAAEAAGARVHPVWAGEDDGFSWSLDALIAGGRDARLMYLCSPNNPTGRYLPPSEVAALARALPDTWLVLDQSFLSLSEHAADARLRLPDNVVAVRSLTKDYALPGLRIGLLWAAAPFVAKVESLRPTWSTAAPAQAAIAAAAAAQPFVRESWFKLRADRDRVRALLSSRGYAPLPSRTCFQLVPVRDARAFRDHLLKAGVLVRDCASFGLPGHVRIAACPAAQLCRLSAALP